MLFKSLLAATVAGSSVSLAHNVPRQNIPLGSSFGVPGDNRTYDYVIVGGGTAGLTLATRLIEQRAGTVGVVEAGSFYEITNGNLSQVPATGSVFSGKGEHDWQPLIDWGYHTTPQVGAFNQELHYARGKTFGGSSARNYMVYQRSTEGAHRLWADLVGDESYTWDRFLPWYKKSVNLTAPNMELRMANSTPEYVLADAIDGSGQGHLRVTWPNYAQAFGTWIAEGWNQLNVAGIQGFMSGNLIGHSWVTFTINPDTQQRETSETAFLRSTIGNPDYTLHPRAMVKRVLFDGTKATGILVDTEGLEYVLSARKEVILTAGVFGTPQILMTSGIGPASLLESLDIPVIADRPGVGQNLQDHVFYGVGYRVNAPTVSSLLDPGYAAEQARLYHEHAAGMYTSPVTDVLNWEKIPAPLRAGWSNASHGALNAMPSDWPEVEYVSIPAFLGSQIYTRHSDPNDGYNYATLGIALVAPQSRGNVSIVSGDTYDHPLINPAFLTHQADVDVAIAAVKRVRQVFATDALQEHVIGDEYFPGSQVSTDDQIADFVRESFNTMWHAACTAAMGRPNDPKAVVDTEGRVYGVQGLRVADAAAFPVLVPGHLISTIYALAEKIACDIAGNC